MARSKLLAHIASDLQFSLRSVLILTTLFAMFLAWIYSPIRDEHTKQQAITKLLNREFTLTKEVVTAASGLSAKAFFGIYDEKYLIEVFSAATEKAPEPDDWATLATLRHLRGLKISPPTTIELTPEQFSIIGSFSKLESLVLDHSQFPESSFESLRHLRSLTILHTDSTSISDQDMAAIAAYPQLQHLKLANCRITDAGAKLLTGATNLIALELTGCDITDASLIGLQSIKGLTLLDVRGTCVTDRGVVDLVKRSVQLTVVTDSGRYGPWELHTKRSDQRYVHFQDITLNGPFATDASLEYLAEMRAINRLLLIGARVTGAGLLKLSQQVDILWLELQNMTLTDELASGIAEMRMLNELSLKNDPRDDELKFLADMQNLETLIISSPHVTDDGIRNLSQLSHLRSMQLRTPRISHETFEVFGNMPSLSSLVLTEIPIDRQRFRALAQNENLLSLSLHSTTTALDTFADGGSHLNSLTFISTRVHDECMDQLAAMQRLRTVAIYGDCGLDLAAVSKLREKRPDIRIMMTDAKGNQLSP